MHKSTQRSPSSSPLKISLLYLLFGMLWIFFSDRIAAGLTASKEQLHTFSNIKGWLFIVITALLLYMALRRSSRQINRHLQKMAGNEILLNRSQSLAHIGSWQLDVESNRLTWTDESYRIFAVSPEEFGGTYEAFLETVHPDDREKVNEAYAHSIRDGRDTYEVEHRVILPDGTIRHIHEKCIHERNAEGAIVRSIGFSHDITERRRAKDALRKNDEMMRNSQSVAHICAYSTDLNINEIGKSAWTCSPEFFNLFGIDETYPHTIDGWANFIHPDFREELVAYHELVVKEKTTFDHEYKIIRINDGAERWVHGTGKLVFDQQGTPIRMHGAIQDITELKQTEYALKESEEKYRALFENAPLPYQSLNEDGCFIDVNPAWLRILGYDREEVIGKWFGDFLHPDFVQHFEKNFPAFKKRGYVKDVQFQIRHKNGDYLHIEFEGCIGYLPDGSFRQTYCVFQDITERKRMEQEIANHRANLEEEVAERTRELRTIVNAMAGREVRMAELKESIAALHTQLLEAGIEPKVEDSGLGEEGTA